MGKGMYRVVYIPEDEAVLLNSREKAPYLICVEVLKSEIPGYAYSCLICAFDYDIVFPLIETSFIVR